MLYLTVLVVLQLNTGSLFAEPPTQELSSDQTKVIQDLPWLLRATAIKQFMRVRPAAPFRKFLVLPYQFNEDLVPARRSMSNLEEDQMKVKLFRMMYASVKDCDVKVKKAEVLRDQYNNSKAFETGYLLGDISDKYNVMTDISNTLKRLYHKWKPIEFVNAYEQIANHAIQINHLIEIMRSVNRKSNFTLRASNPGPAAKL